MTHTPNPTRDRLQAALVRVLHKDPFFSVPALHTPFVEAPGLGTMATDGMRIMYDPEEIATWSDAKLDYVIAHEGCHVILRHPLRADHVISALPEDQRKAAHAVSNIVMDWIVNHHLDRSGWIGGEDGIRDPRGASQSFESLFREEWAKLPEDEKTDPSGGGYDPSNQCSDPGGCGGVLVPSPEDLEGKYGQGSKEANAEAMKRDLSQIAVNAERAARRAAGADRGDTLREIVEELTGGTMDWRPILRRWLRDAFTPDGYSYHRPSRRGRAIGKYLPVPREREGARYMVLALDCSGSVDPDMLRDFMSEAQSMRDEIKPERVDVLFFDTSVRRVQSFGRMDPLELKEVYAGGGTALRAPFDWVDENATEDPVCMIVYTDGYGWDISPGSRWDEPEPTYPVLWALWGRYADECVRGRLAPFPFGESVGIVD